MLYGVVLMQTCCTLLMPAIGPVHPCVCVFFLCYAQCVAEERLCLAFKACCKTGSSDVVVPVMVR